MSTTKPAVQEEPITVQWSDPRLADGEPAAAADLAIEQLTELIRLLQVAGTVTHLMVRNASMSEALNYSIDNDPAAWWAESKQKHHFDAAMSNLAELKRWTARTVAVYRDTRG